MFFEPELGQLLIDRNNFDYSLDPDKQHAVLIRLERLSHMIDSGCIGHNCGNSYSNSVFEMHDYYWGNCTCGYSILENEWLSNNRHFDSCYQKDWENLSEVFGFIGIPPKEIKRICKKHGISYKKGLGCALHCTCDYNERWKEFSSIYWHKDDCPIIRPNFRFEDVQIRWYKYLGRGMSFNRDLNKGEIEEIFNLCEDSIRNG